MTGYNTDDKSRYLYGSEAYDFDTYIDAPVEEEVTRKIKRRKLKKGAIANKLMCMYMGGLILVVSLASVFGYTIIYHSKKEVDRLTLELQSLKKDTVIIENQIISGANLNNIYDIATNKLGMVRPTADKINYISIDNQSYTRQYGSLTNEKNKVSGESFLASIIKKGE